MAKIKIDDNVVLNAGIPSTSYQGGCKFMGLTPTGGFRVHEVHPSTGAVCLVPQEQIPNDWDGKFYWVSPHNLP